MQILKNIFKRQTQDAELVDLFRNEYRKEYNYQRRIGTTLNGDYVKNFLTRS